MAALRLRHPGGVSTLSIDMDSSTVLDLQAAVYSSTDIPPDAQVLKSGYPPRTISLDDSSILLSTLGIKKGDQLIVSVGTGGSSPSPATPSPAKPAGPSTPKSTVPKPAAIPKKATSLPLPSVNPSDSKGAEDWVRTEGGFLVLREVPDDNSCLFSSVALIFEADITAANRMRELVAKEIKQNMDTYTDAVLGHPRDKYIQQILKPMTWGGAIELSIFSEYYKTEIASFDVETGRCDWFGEGKFDNLCFLMYSGIHYDAVSFTFADEGDRMKPSKNTAFHQTQFSKAESSKLMSAASELAKRRREKGQFTNTSTFDLKCLVCGTGMKGEKEARKHAESTGHAQFGQY